MFLHDCLLACEISTVRTQTLSMIRQRPCVAGLCNEACEQFRPPIALRTDLSHITTEIPVLRMAH